MFIDNNRASNELSKSMEALATPNLTRNKQVLLGVEIMLFNHVRKLIEHDLGLGKESVN